MPALNGMTERRETSDLQPRTEDKPIKRTPGTAGKELASYYIKNKKGISSSRNERKRQEEIGTALPCLAPLLRLLPCMDCYQALPLDFP